MYMIDTFIELGLKEGQEWPTPAHRVVACNVALCNPLVKTRDMLTDIVQAVLKVPAERIEALTFDQLAQEYGCPRVW